MSGVFLNYRTGDGDWAATLLKRELSVRFGVDNVFFASSSIPSGVDFAYQITQRLPECDVLLAIIGSRWLTAVDRRGRRRIDHLDDWVRPGDRRSFHVPSTPCRFASETAAAAVARPMLRSGY